MILTRLDKATFEFPGKPNATYNLLAHSGLVIHVALSGDGRYWHWADITLPAAGKALFDEKGLGRIDAAGWRVDVWRKPEVQSSSAHLEIYVLEHPADVSGATGLHIDGSAEADPDHYLVKAPPGGGTNPP